MKLKFSDVFFKGAVEYNPVVIQCVGLCPVILASTNLKDALIMSGLIIADLIINCFIASALLKKIPRVIRVAIYMLVSLLIILPTLWFIGSKSLMTMSLAMRVCIPLIAVNSVTAVHCEQFAVKNNVRLALYDGIAAGFGVMFILVILGVLREIIGNGSILGYPLDLTFKLSGLLMPYGALVVLGFIAAISKAVFTSGQKQKPAEEKPVQESPDEAPAREEAMPEQIELDLNYVDNENDEYAYLLSSVNELIASFTDDKEGGNEE